MLLGELAALPVGPLLAHPVPELLVLAPVLWDHAVPEARLEALQLLVPLVPLEAGAAPEGSVPRELQLVEPHLVPVGDLPFAAQCAARLDPFREGWVLRPRSGNEGVPVLVLVTLQLLVAPLVRARDVPHELDVIQLLDSLPQEPHPRLQLALVLDPLPKSRVVVPLEGHNRVVIFRPVLQQRLVHQVPVLREALPLHLVSPSPPKRLLQCNSVQTRQLRPVLPVCVG
mmetsp:Transcript_4564/g.14968  ORF Transcript_4564/g.14968 Transcript_4564/m.14968 type:complete len:228 (-) Transcript_4564:196-879(-)